MLAGVLAVPLGGVPSGANGLDVPDGITEWTSKAATGSGGRELSTVTADGRYVAYVGRGEGQGVWLTDRRAGTTTRLTTGSHFNPAISDDGRFVAFVVYGANRTVQLLEVATGTVETVSLGDDDQPASGLSDFPSVSADGRFVAFQSTDTTLDDDVTDPPAGGGPNRAYVRDRLLGETEMVGVTDGGEASQGSAIKPDISPDGRFVAFAAEAANLLPPAPAPGAAPAAEEEEPSAAQQIYLRDRDAGTTTLVTLGTDDLPGDAISAPVFGPTVSDDGTRVAFESLAANLVEGDTNLDVDAFVADLTAGTIQRISLDSAGNQVDLPNPVIEPLPAAPPVDEAPPDPMVGGGAAISGDGLVVAFVSEAPLTPDDVNGTAENLVKDVYAVDLGAATLERVSLANPGGTDATGTRVDGNTGETVAVANGNDPTIDRYGRHVSFTTNGNLTGDRPVAEEEAAPAAVEPVVSTEPAIYTRLRFGNDGWFVRALYLDVLDRPADDGGLVYWVERTWASAARSDVVRAMTGTAAARNVLVREAYLDMLGRAADPAGLSFWSGKLATGTTIEQVEASLLGSAEAYAKAGSTATGFTTYAYQAVLLRAPDAGGLAHWVAFLEDGGSRTTMARSMIRSRESAGIQVREAFGELLDRAPDAGALTFWVDSLAGGTSRSAMVRNILSSGEYYARAEAHVTDV